MSQRRRKCFRSHILRMGTSDHVQPRHCYFGILALESLRGHYQIEISRIESFRRLDRPPRLLACDFSALRVGSSTYGGQLVAKFFSRGRQAVDAVLAVAVFVCGCAFVDVRLAPSQ